MEADTPAKVVYMETTEAYDKWAQVYDTDGNFLQAIDNRELVDLLPKFLADAEIDAPGHELRTIVDLGCGTGRNTLKLCRLRPQARVIGLDNSEGMLKVARAKAERKTSDSERANPEFRPFDIDKGNESDVPAERDGGRDDGIQVATDPRSIRRAADAVISTLVIEHIALAPFFGTAARLLRPGGHLLLTNMHADMGRVSQAGFVDPRTGEKIRPTSYAHMVREVVDEAARWGFEVRGDVRERDVVEADVEVLGPRSRKWVGVWCWFGIAFRLTT